MGVGVVMSQGSVPAAAAGVQWRTLPFLPRPGIFSAINQRQACPGRTLFAHSAFNGVPHAYFLLDSDGIVRWSHVEEHPGKSRTNAEILAAVAAA